MQTIVDAPFTPHLVYDKLFVYGDNSKVNKRGSIILTCELSP